MYCPRCATEIVEGQNFCRNCGVSVAVILDAVSGKDPAPLDFERLKRDFRELRESFRGGWEGAGAIKRTHRFGAQTGPRTQDSKDPQSQSLSREIYRALRKVKAAHTRKYSLQQATLSIVGGGAVMAVWYRLLNTAAESGFLRSIELTILQHTGTPVVGLAEVLQLTWLLGLIPVARGVAHLFNGIFLVPKRIEQEEAPSNPAPGYIYSSPVNNISTKDLENELKPKTQQSITEDETVRFEPR
jgi:zinc-ribbon domain